MEPFKPGVCIFVTCEGKWNENSLTISGMVSRPVAKTIALGGVATGNINANEEQTVAGIIR